MRSRQRLFWVVGALVAVLALWLWWSRPTEETSLESVLAACDGERIARFSGWAGDAPPPGATHIDQVAVAWFAEQQGYTDRIQRVEDAWVVGDPSRPLAVVTLGPAGPFGRDVDTYWECRR